MARNIAGRVHGTCKDRSICAVHTGLVAEFGLVVDNRLGVRSGLSDAKSAKKRSALPIARSKVSRTFLTRVPTVCLHKLLSFHILLVFGTIGRLSLLSSAEVGTLARYWIDSGSGSLSVRCGISQSRLFRLGGIRAGKDMLDIHELISHTPYRIANPVTWSPLDHAPRSKPLLLLLKEEGLKDDVLVRAGRRQG